MENKIVIVGGNAQEVIERLVKENTRLRTGLKEQKQITAQLEEMNNNQRETIRNYQEELSLIHNEYGRTCDENIKLYTLLTAVVNELGKGHSIFSPLGKRIFKRLEKEGLDELVKGV